MLADLLAPFDYPRRSAYNLARSGGNVFTGDASWQDLLRALPAAGGLAATPFLGPLGGAGIAAGLQGLGGLVAPEAFAAPTPADLLENIPGADPEKLLQGFAAQVFTDPLTYAGGVGAVRAGRGALGEARAATGIPPFPKGPMAYPDVNPRQMGPLPREAPGPLGPEFGTPRYDAQVQAAIEADAVASAAREAMPPPFRGVGDQPWIPPREPAGAAAYGAGLTGPGLLHPELGPKGLYNVLKDMKEDLGPIPPRTPDIEARAALLKEIGQLERAANPDPAWTMPYEEMSPYRTPEHLGRLRAAQQEANALEGLLFGRIDLPGEMPPLLRGVERDAPLLGTVGEATTALNDVMGQLRHAMPFRPEIRPPGSAWLPLRIDQLTGGQLPIREVRPLLAELEAAFPLDRARAVEAYRQGLGETLRGTLNDSLYGIRQLQRYGTGPESMATGMAADQLRDRLGLSQRGVEKLMRRLGRVATGPMPESVPGRTLQQGYEELTAPVREDLLNAALRRAGLM